MPGSRTTRFRPVSLLPRAGLVWTPLLAWHAGTVAFLIGMDLVFGSRSDAFLGGFCTFLLVLTGIPWSAFALPTYGTAFAVLIYACALANLAAHAWWLRHEERGDTP